jgi:hypothetical protein
LILCRQADTMTMHVVGRAPGEEQHKHTCRRVRTHTHARARAHTHTRTHTNAAATVLPKANASTEQLLELIMSRNSSVKIAYKQVGALRCTAPLCSGAGFFFCNMRLNRHSCHTKAAAQLVKARAAEKQLSLCQSSLSMAQSAQVDILTPCGRTVWCPELAPSTCKKYLHTRH